ncbi:MAG TPA: TIR domain-containing protein [Pyrinomonadaceae bacterium]|jgi:hypothetical protein
MARRAFFSFHYSRDIWRANVVRNSWMTHADRTAAGFWDASLWEEAKRKGRAAIERMIDTGLRNTSVTEVLIGAETAYRDYVRYEIAESHGLGKGLLGIYINNIANHKGIEDDEGENPFNHLYFDENGRRTFLSEIYPTYDWFGDDGYLNIGSWIETAALAAGR